MNKTFYLLKLEHNKNTVLNQICQPHEGHAIKLYQNLYPELGLNNNGYAQGAGSDRYISYCIATKFGK